MMSYKFFRAPPIESHQILQGSLTDNRHDRHKSSQHVTTIALHLFLNRCSMRCVSHRGHKKSGFWETEMDQVAKSLRSWKQRDPWRMNLRSYKTSKGCIFMHFPRAYFALLSPIAIP